MSSALLATAFLRRRWGQALAALLAGALSIALVQAVMIAERELPKAAEQAFGGVDLVIGPKGSALDLVLCCVLHVTEPRGIVPLASAEQALSSPMIKAVAPIALGDNYKSVRIVGTTPDLLQVYKAQLAQGALWTKDLQAVVGAQIAREHGLKLGDSFVGSHGLVEGGEEHSEFPYTVTGILAPTGSGLDRLILTSIQSVWTIHAHHEADEAEEKGLPAPPVPPPAASAFVASVKSPVALAALPRQIDAMDHLSAAAPAFEIARLARAARPVIQAVYGIGLLFALVAGLTAATVFVSALAARTRDLGLLRVLGSHPWELALIAQIEALILALLALVGGEAVVWTFAPPMARLLAERDGLLISVLPAGHDILVLAGGTFVVALVAALFPALKAGNASIETVLSP
jgi:putative ABC transport system permease protein